MPAPSITPSGPLSKRGKEVQAFTATGTVVDWTTTGGALTDETSTGATWTAPNVTGTYTVTATNAEGSDVVTITVTAEVPAYWSYRTTAEHKKKVLSFEPEEGARQYQEKQGKKAAYDIIAVENLNEYFDEMLTFWDEHYPGKQFYFNDIIIGFEALYQIDSNMKYDPSNGFDRIQWSFVIKEV